jgi:hypothetical protein
MESVGDLLGRYKPQQPPDEVLAVKRYIADEFGAQSSVALQNGAIVITVQSAALANTLRLRTSALQEACKTTKRLLFRIG